MGLLNLFHRAPMRHHSRSADHTVRLQLEALEARIVPYALSGNAWPHPQLVTISFMPDGTDLGGVSSNLVATFNAKFGSPAAWQNVILKAAQTWAQATNVNFAVVPDSGVASGAGSYQQGAPGQGDIRIGGYNFGSGSTGLAMADMPPPVNNYSIAGDIVFNTAQSFNVGRTYDLYTVALHEIGHALGLGHSGGSSAVMYASYHGALSGLNSDDAAGVEQIYSNGAARSADQYKGANSTIGSATNINSLINTSSLTALVTGLNLNTSSGLLGTTAGVEYFTFTVPSGTTGTMTVNVQSQGLSLLAPTLTVYNSSQSQVAYVSGAGQYGTTLSLKVSGVSAGQQYYVKVAGADTSPFGTGTYALTLNFGSGPSPTVPLPNTATPDGTPASGSGGIALQAGQSGQTGLLGGLVGGLLGGVVQFLFDRAPVDADPANWDIFPAAPDLAPPAGPSLVVTAVPATAQGSPGGAPTVSPDWLAAATLIPWNPQVLASPPSSLLGINVAQGVPASPVPAALSTGSPVRLIAAAPRLFPPSVPVETSEEMVPNDNADTPPVWYAGADMAPTGTTADHDAAAGLDGTDAGAALDDRAVQALSPARCDACFAGTPEEPPVHAACGMGLAAVAGGQDPARRRLGMTLAFGVVSAGVIGALVRHRPRQRPQPVAVPVPAERA